MKRFLKLKHIFFLYIRLFADISPLFKFFYSLKFSCSMRTAASDKKLQEGGIGYVLKGARTISLFEKSFFIAIAKIQILCRNDGTITFSFFLIACYTSFSN